MVKISVQVKYTHLLKYEQDTTGDSTSYLELKVQGYAPTQLQQTKCHKSINGKIEFNESFEFDVVTDDKLRITLKDEIFSDDKYIGYALIAWDPAFYRKNYETSADLIKNNVKIGDINVDLPVI